MYFSLPARRVVAFVMLILTLNVMMIGFAPEGASINSFKAGICHALSFEDTAGAGSTYDLANFKPPKHTFIDYTTFFGSAFNVPTYLPVIAFMIMGSIFQYLPTIYTEIPVPPIII